MKKKSSKMNEYESLSEKKLTVEFEKKHHPFSFIMNGYLILLEKKYKSLIDS